jgi:HPt (histidine-containing phosphotransfer) domain-containing protein
MSSFESRMAALAERFRRRAREDAEQIRGALSGGDRGTLLRVSHGLSGTAGIFGHHDVGDAAEQVELAIEENMIPAEIDARCRSLLARIDAVAA